MPSPYTERFTFTPQSKFLVKVCLVIMFDFSDYTLSKKICAPTFCFLLDCALYLRDLKQKMSHQRPTQTKPIIESESIRL